MSVNTLEASIRRLTQPVSGQFPRPWMTDMTRPEKALVFVVGYNQATGFSVDKVYGGDHNAYIDSLFNRNGKSCRALYEQIRGGKGPSPTRKNIDCLRNRLAKRGICDVLETNVICYAAPMGKDLAQDGKAAGRPIFLEILRIIRPIILIAHGVKTRKKLGRVLSTKLPAAASNQADGVSCARVHTQPRGESYAPMVFVIPSLAPPEWNKWKNWAPPHLDQLCELVRKFLDNHQRNAW